jgi:poly(A) polymerase
MEVPRMRESTLKRFMRMPDFEEHMALHRLDCLSSHGGLDNYEFVRRKQSEAPAEALKPAPLLTGRDLIAAGYRPGPAFGAVLHEIEDAQLEGRISTVEEALRMARQKLDSETPLTR